MNNELFKPGDLVRVKDECRLAFSYYERMRRHDLNAAGTFEVKSAEVRSVIYKSLRQIVVVVQGGVLSSYHWSSIFEKVEFGSSEAHTLPSPPGINLPLVSLS